MKRNIKQIRAVIDDLGYDFAQFQIKAFVQHVARIRKRPIILNHWTLDDNISGLWIYKKQLDFLIYTSNTHPVHQTHIILHEIAHMLLDHPREKLTGVLAGVDEQAIGRLRVAGVNAMNDDYEWEAEQFVLIIREYLFRADRLKALTEPLSSNEALSAITESLFVDERRTDA